MTEKTFETFLSTLRSEAQAAVAHAGTEVQARETLELVRNYRVIADAGERQAIFDLVKAMAQRQSGHSG
jgi:hypothetical protein